MGIDDGRNNTLLTMVILFKFVTPDIVRFVTTVFRDTSAAAGTAAGTYPLGRRFSLKTLLRAYIIYAHGRWDGGRNGWSEVCDTVFSDGPANGRR